MRHAPCETHAPQALRASPPPSPVGTPQGHSKPFSLIGSGRSARRHSLAVARRQLLHPGRPRRQALLRIASLRTFHLADALSSPPMFLCLLPTSLLPRERRVPGLFPQRCGTWAEAPRGCFRPFLPQVPAPRHISRTRAEISRVGVLRKPLACSPLKRVQVPSSKCAVNPAGMKRVRTA